MLRPTHLAPVFQIRHISLCQETKHPKKVTPYHKAFKQKDQVSISNSWHSLLVFTVYAARRHAQSNPLQFKCFLSTMLTRSLAALQSTELCVRAEFVPWHHPCLIQSDYEWDSCLVRRHSTGMGLAGNVNLAVVLDEQSTPQAGPGCHAMMITDSRILILGGNAQSDLLLSQLMR